MVANPVRSLALSAFLVWSSLFGPGAAASDVFDFIPAGGRTLLARALEGKPDPAEVSGLLSGKHDRTGWLTYLKEHGKGLPSLQRLGDKELVTLADYLFHHMPLPADKAQAAGGRANWPAMLPQDGRDVALNYCQNCHVITVVVTQDRSREAWLGTMHKPSHVQIKLSEAQREELADYLILNAAIPIDQVPEDLRVGGATY